MNRRCPPRCACLCHDTGGGVHNHPGAPCPGKAARSMTPAAAVRVGAVVWMQGLDIDSPHLVTITRIHNADPEAGRIRWETAVHGDVTIGGAAMVEVVEY